MTAALDALLGLLPRLSLDVLGVALLLWGVRRRRPMAADVRHTLWLLNLVVFAVVATLSQVKMHLGLGLGLFGVFGILRFRTNAMSGRDVTVLFVVIGFAMLTSVANTPALLAEVGLAVVGIAAAAGLMSHRAGVTLSIHYDRPELLAPARRKELIADLEERFGAQVRAVSADHVDLVKGTAELDVELGDAPALDTTAAPRRPSTP